MSTKAHLDAVFDNAKVMQHIAGRLDRLASSFDVTGNEKVAEMLYNIAEEICAAGERVSNSFSEMQAEQFRETQHNTANLLTALVAGVEMGKKEKANAKNEA